MNIIYLLLLYSKQKIALQYIYKEEEKKFNFFFYKIFFFIYLL